MAFKIYLNMTARIAKLRKNRVCNAPVDRGAPSERTHPPSQSPENEISRSRDFVEKRHIIWVCTHANDTAAPARLINKAACAQTSLH